MFGSMILIPYLQKWQNTRNTTAYLSSAKAYLFVYQNCSEIITWLS